jgi:hypothetical protein
MNFSSRSQISPERKADIEWTTKLLDWLASEVDSILW